MIKRTEKQIMSTWKYGTYDNPIVSVRVTAYNHERFIEQALDGILSQITEYSFQIVVHDDASTDNTASIIRDYYDKYSRIIRPIFEDENQYSKEVGSLGRKVNPFCIGKYIAYCEGDDYWIDENKIQMEVDFLEENSSYFAVYSNILPINEKGEYDESLRAGWEHLKEGKYNEKEIAQCELKTQLASLVCRNIYRTMTSDDYHAYTECHSAGDRKLFVLFSKYGQIYHMEAILAAHRKVIKSGDSWSAKVHKMTKAKKLKMKFRANNNLAQLYEYCHNRKTVNYQNILISLRSRIALFHEKDSSEKIIYQSIIQNRAKYTPSVFLGFLSYIIVQVFKKISLRKKLKKKKIKQFAIAKGFEIV